MSRVAAVTVAGAGFAADLSGALFWERERLLVVSDLHLEKGSSFAMRGVLLPPYDTVATLDRLASAAHSAASRADAGGFAGGPPRDLDFR